METIESLFHEQFGFWNIALPDGAVASGKAGAIGQYDWAIQYKFGQDERGKYMDYYAVRPRRKEGYARIHRRLYEEASEADPWEQYKPLPTPYDHFHYRETDSKEDGIGVAGNGSRRTNTLTNCLRINFLSHLFTKRQTTRTQCLTCSLPNSWSGV